MARMHGMKRTWVCACVALTLAASAQAAPLRSGLYEGLMLAVDARGAVSGSFAQQGSCTFQVTGTASPAGTAVVRTLDHTPVLSALPALPALPALEGRLSAGADSVSLALPGGQQLPGCGNVLPPLIDKGLALDLTQKGTWTRLVSVAAEKTALRKTPADAGRAYVVRGDVLGVVSQRADLLEVDFVNGQGRVVRGWIATKDAKTLGAP